MDALVMKYPHPDDFCIEYLLRHPGLWAGAEKSFVTTLVFSSSRDWRGYYRMLYAKIKQGSIEVDSALFARVCRLRDPRVQLFFLLSRPARFIAPPVFARLCRKTMRRFSGKKRLLHALAGALLQFGRWHPAETRLVGREIRSLLGNKSGDIQIAALPSAVRAGIIDEHTVKVLMKALNHAKESPRLLGVESLECIRLLTPTKRKAFSSLLNERQRTKLKSTVKTPRLFGRTASQMRETIGALLAPALVRRRTNRSGPAA
jgi:hypothetical protein